MSTALPIRITPTGRVGPPEGVLTAIFPMRQKEVKIRWCVESPRRPIQFRQMSCFHPESVVDGRSFKTIAGTYLLSILRYSGINLLDVKLNGSHI